VWLRVIGSDGQSSKIWLYLAARTAIRRHVKGKNEANPYDPDWDAYFEQRAVTALLGSVQAKEWLRKLWYGQQGAVSCLPAQNHQAHGVAAFVPHASASRRFRCDSIRADGGRARDFNCIRVLVPLGSWLRIGLTGVAELGHVLTGNDWIVGAGASPRCS
jgi:hypothetical protein